MGNGDIEWEQRAQILADLEVPVFDWDGRRITVGEYRRLVQERGRQVADAIIGDRWWVSTVFLGVGADEDSAGRSLIFETMVFDHGYGDEASVRLYATLEEALEGHAEACATVGAS